MKFYTLSNGMQIPVIGIGTNTFGKEGNKFSAEINGDIKELKTAIQTGYRLIDTAIMYRNECVIGNAVIESGIDRDEFFITSKIPNKPEYIGSDEAVHKAVQLSLSNLKIDWIDLYLVHHPWDDNDDMVRVWRILESYVEQGKIKALGVSNFNERQLQHILEHAYIKPVVNQIESHPGKWQHELIDFCLKNNVRPEAWGPLSRVDDAKRLQLQEIADAYHKTWAQLILRYQYELGMIVIPKSHDAQRQQRNLEIFDFQLTETDKKQIGSL